MDGPRLESAAPGECTPRQGQKAFRELCRINDQLAGGHAARAVEPIAVLQRVEFLAVFEPPGVRPGPNYQLAFYFAQRYLSGSTSAAVQAAYYWGALMALQDGEVPDEAFPPELSEVTSASLSNTGSGAVQAWNAAALVGAAAHAPQLSDKSVAVALGWWRNAGALHNDYRLRQLAPRFRDYGQRHSCREACEASVDVYRVLQGDDHASRGACEVNARLYEWLRDLEEDDEAGFSNDFANALTDLFRYSRDPGLLVSAWAESEKAIGLNSNPALAPELRANQIRIASVWAGSGHPCPWLPEYLQNVWAYGRSMQMAAQVAARFYANLADLQPWDFNLNGDVTALDRAVAAANLAVAAANQAGQTQDAPISSGQPARADAYSKRFLITQDPADAKTALEAYERAVEEEDDPHQVAHLLSDRSNLRVSMQSVGATQLVGAAEDIDQAVGLEPDSCPELQRTLEAAARVHLELFKLDNDPAELRSAHRFGERALKLTASGDPERGRRDHLIGAALHTLGLLEHDADKLRKAVDHFDSAASATPDSWDEGAFRHCAARAAADLADAVGDPAMLTRSRERYRTIARDETAPATTRWDSAESAAQISLHVGDKQGALADLDQGVDILYALAWRGRPVAARFAELAPRSTTLPDAVHLALELGEPDRALQIAERGRAVVWQDLLDLRALDTAEHDRTELQYGRDVARRLRKLEHQLAAAEAQHLPKSAIEPIEMDRRATDAEWRRMRRELATTPTQQRPTAARISAALHDNQSVVVVCPGDRSGFVLHLPSGQTIELAGLTSEACTTQLSEFTETFSEFLNDRTKARWQEVNDRCRDLLQWTWSTVAVPVLAACDTYHGAAQMHQVFWYALGPAALLPLHSASAFSADGVVTDSVLDRTLSASIVSLLPDPNGMDDQTLEPGDWRVLAAPEAVGLPPLSGSREESEAVAEALGIPKEALNLTATAEDLLDATAHARAIHVACHGSPMSANGESSVWMTDRRVELSEIAFADDLSLRWAFISACSSADAPLGVADQGASLASGLAALGCLNVIGTLWQLSDKTAAYFARFLHQELSSAGGRRPSYTPSAVKKATLQLRHVAEAFPVCWAAYQHLTHLRANPTHPD